MREPFLSETDAPPRRHSLTLATPQKSFLRIFDFARARFFLPRLRRGFGGQVKGKENFFAGFCSERAGRRGFCARTARHSSPNLLRAGNQPRQSEKSKSPEKQIFVL